MIRFALRRLANGVVLIFAISFAAFTLLYLGAGDVAREILGPSASQETVELKREQLGLNDPLLSRYVDWLTNALHGNLGRSWFTSQHVSEAIMQRLSVTLSLVIGTVLVSAILAVILGVTAARIGGRVDRLLQLLVLVGIAIPGFLVAIVLVQFFAIRLGWFNATGFVPLTTSVPDWLRSVVLPIAALSVSTVAASAQQIRGSVKDTLRQDWVRTLRSRGISENRVVLKHVLRNASSPALTVLALQFVGLLGGAVIIEQMFAIPGLGQVSVTATIQGDIPLVMGLVVAIATIVIIVNLVIDLIQGLLNPKVRLS